MHTRGSSIDTREPREACNPAVSAVGWFELPVALASGNITEELRAQAPAAGVGELVYKPNTVDELCEVVARLANAQRVNGHSS